MNSRLGGRGQGRSTGADGRADDPGRFRLLRAISESRPTLVGGAPRAADEAATV